MKILMLAWLAMLREIESGCRELRIFRGKSELLIFMHSGKQ
jgi:hypothetical protein